LRDNPELHSLYQPLKIDDKTLSTKSIKGFVFAGDHINIDREDLNSIFKFRKYSFFDDVEIGMNNLQDHGDLLIANFENGKKHNKKALFAMGVAYQTKTPTILLEGNNIPYPPLLGLARRVMTGEGKIDYTIQYLRNIRSQHIKNEALTYYYLMKQFNK
jgi:hypothetical protein